MNTYLVRVAMRKKTKEYTILAQTTDQAEQSVWDILEQSGEDKDVIMFDTSRLVEAAE